MQLEISFFGILKFAKLITWKIVSISVKITPVNKVKCHSYGVQRKLFWNVAGVVQSVELTSFHENKCRKFEISEETQANCKRVPPIFRISRFWDFVSHFSFELILYNIWKLVCLPTFTWSVGNKFGDRGKIHFQVMEALWSIGFIPPPQSVH